MAIAMRANLSLFDGVATSAIHQVLVEAAASFISPESPAYQFAAGRLFLAQIRKQVWGDVVPPDLGYVIQTNHDLGVYAEWTVNDYSEAEIADLSGYINHERDFRISYAGLRQLVAKYLLVDRVSNYLYETPQFMYMLIAMGLFKGKPAAERLGWVKQAYDDYSLFRTNLPTPTMAGVRSTVKSYASCCLMEVDDNLPSIAANLHACTGAVAGRYGLGLDFMNIRGIGARIRGGEAVHSGVIPFLKMYASVIRGLYQGGVRQGSATVYFQWWHWEIEDIIMLRNIGGAEESRERNLDYAIACDSVLIDAAMNNEDVTLFSPEDVPELLDSFGMPEFPQLYREACQRPGIRKKVISAQAIIDSALIQRYETSRIYFLFIDAANRHTPWLQQVRTSNLCTEILFPLVPVQDTNGDTGEIGVCVLAAVNVLEVFSDILTVNGKIDYSRISTNSVLPGVCRRSVHALDGLIDTQTYFHPAAKRFTQKRRALGVGITNLAALFAREGLTYDDAEAPNLASAIMEAVEFHLLHASCEMAKMHGPCEGWLDTKWSHNLFPQDTYAKSVDEFVTLPPQMPWEELRFSVAEYGLRHSTVTAIMPAESSSVVQNATNGIEPPKALKAMKKSQAGGAMSLVPGSDMWHYQLAFDTTNAGRLRVAAALQKWVDMGVSLNLYYNPAHTGGTVSIDSVMDDFMTAHHLGLHTLYYSLANDGDKHSVESSTPTPRVLNAEVELAALRNDPRVCIDEATSNPRSARELHSGGESDDLGCASGACSI